MMVMEGLYLCVVRIDFICIYLFFPTLYMSLKRNKVKMNIRNHPN